MPHADSPTHARSRPPRVGTAALLAAAATLAAACGGASVDSAPREPSAAAVAPPPLFDADGRARLSPASLVPADTAARTRSGLYATRAQLAWEELVATPCSVVIDVDAVGSVGAAVQLAEQVRYWRDTRGLVFFVRARHPVDAARVADRLADAGFAPVFAVV